MREPDVFTQMPLTRTVKVERLRYMTDPLPHDVDVVGPIALTLYAAIDQNDTNWIVVLKDVGPDVSVRTAREGERAVPQNLPERELTRGWLKASYRAVDEKRSKPWEPFHKLTRDGHCSGRPRRNRRVQNSNSGYGQSVQSRPPDLSRHHINGCAHRHGRDDQRRIHSLSRVQQPDGDPPDLSGRGKAIPSAVADHS